MDSSAVHKEVPVFRRESINAMSKIHQAIAEELCQAGWIRIIETSAGGKP